MTVTTELKEIKEMLRKMIRDMTKIRQTQKQMKAEMYEVKDDLKRFRELWKKEKAEIENRLQKLEEDKVKRELMQRLNRFEKMEEAIELKEKKSSNWELPNSSQQLQESEMIQKHIENIAKKERASSSTVNIEYKKLCINEKNMLLKDGQRFIRQFFGAGKTDL
ncbi:uncharacterized protein LOC100678250 [Nasonia vitripennis]|uniref:Uncharacterized protein n=1 Tax=Nasonia vitripennis TaxID=7425 RepID=A0A7M7GDL4_NASVI|nr:uncharacterized protein LOC100678250 [Nasonia vitripennis]